jgi:hypothetical protein
MHGIGSNKMTRKLLLGIAVVIVVVIGLGLILTPALVVRLFFSSDLAGVGMAIGRLAGLGLLSLAIACWPLPTPTLPALRGMLAYNLMTTAYLALQLIRGRTGQLLSLLLVIHALLAVLLAAAWLRDERVAQRRLQSEDVKPVGND